jgi:GTPase SAR1 family protein
MSRLSLSQTLILGCPNVGKSAFLKSLSNQIFTPIKKEGRKLKYLFVKKTFRETQEKTRKELLKYIKTHSILYLDEPFYYLLPFIEKELFRAILKKDYVMATHRAAYFLLFSPSIILINKKGGPINVKISVLKKLIRKPSLNFFQTDLINYSKFLNQFNDIHLDATVINKIKNYSLFRKTRTTYLIRDFLIWFLVCSSPGRFL